MHKNHMSVILAEWKGPWASCWLFGYMTSCFQGAIQGFQNLQMDWNDLRKTLSSIHLLRWKIAHTRPNFLPHLEYWKFKSFTYSFNIFATKLFYRILVSLNPNPSPFCSTTSYMDLEWNWDKWTKWPQKDLEHYKANSTPDMLLVSLSPKFQTISFYEQPFWGFRPLWENCTEWQQNYLEYYKVKDTPYVCFLVSLSPKFQVVPSITSHIWVTGHFQTSTLNDPK